MSGINTAEEKRERILRAGMECFAKNGYRKTAVDEIVDKAGISKGLLFHYYGNKLGFYLYLYRFAYGLVYNQTLASLDNGERDLFEKIRQSEQVKIRLLGQYPYIQDFLFSAWEETDEKLIGEIRDTKKTFKPWQEDFLQGVDLGKLRDGLDIRQIMKIIRWVGGGVLEQYGRPIDLDKVSEALDAYLDTLKRGFYKEEYL